MLVAFIAVAALATALMPGQFLRVANLQNMMRNLPEYGLLAFGVMLAMTIGGIDLSGVSVVSLSGVVAALILAQYEAIGAPTWVVIILAIAAAIGTAALCGLVNGLIISVARVPAIIATLGTNGLFLGLAVALTGGGSVGGFPMEYVRIANGSFLGIPITFWVFVVVACGLWFFLDRTSLGFQMRMLGSNPVAARFAGFNNRAILIKSFVLIAVLAGIAAVLLTSKVATMRPNYGQEYLLLAVLLSILGGTNPDGGFSTVVGVVIATLTLQVIATASTFLGFTPFMRNFLYGIILLGIMVIHFYRNSGKFTQIRTDIRARFRGAEGQ